jgi:hypothetical protein
MKQRQRKNQSFEEEYGIEVEHLEISGREEIRNFEEEILEEDIDEPKIYVFDVEDSDFTAVSRSSENYHKVDKDEDYVGREIAGEDVYHEGDVKSVVYVSPRLESGDELVEDFMKSELEGEMIGDNAAEKKLNGDNQNYMARGCLRE